MHDERSTALAVIGANDIDTEQPHHALRRLGARAHQLLATTRAADHYNGCDSADGRNTSSWLIVTALEFAREIAADIDTIIRRLRERQADAMLQQSVAALRVCAQQLSAATEAADHYLVQGGPADRNTGSSLMATALTLAQQLAGEIDDSTAQARRPRRDRLLMDKTQALSSDAAAMQRVAAAAAQLI